jgi:hypothetical protein
MYVRRHLSSIIITINIVYITGKTRENASVTSVNLSSRMAPQRTSLLQYTTSNNLDTLTCNVNMRPFSHDLVDQDAFAVGIELLSLETGMAMERHSGGRQQN